MMGRLPGYKSAERRVTCRSVRRCRYACVNYVLWMQPSCSHTSVFINLKQMGRFLRHLQAWIFARAMAFTCPPAQHSIAIATPSMYAGSKCLCPAFKSCWCTGKPHCLSSRATSLSISLLSCIPSIISWRCVAATCMSATVSNVPCLSEMMCSAGCPLHSTKRWCVLFAAPCACGEIAASELILNSSTRREASASASSSSTRNLARPHTNSASASLQALGKFMRHRFVPFSRRLEQSDLKQVFHWIHYLCMCMFTR